MGTELNLNSMNMDNMHPLEILGMTLLFIISVLRTLITPRKEFLYPGCQNEINTLHCGILTSEMFHHTHTLNF